jgi:hypothetical protein
VINPVEKLRQVYIDDEPIAVGDIGLRLRHRLSRECVHSHDLGRAPRPEAVAVLAECRVPQRLEPLEHRLLAHAVDQPKSGGCPGLKLSLPMPFNPWL